jgi:hypothetical protein
MQNESLIVAQASRLWQTGGTPVPQNESFLIPT